MSIYKLLFKKTINIYHLALAVLSAFYYRFPFRKMTVIGVTGTNGKTTTTHLISHILQFMQRQNIGHISSVSFKIGKKQIINKMKMTMPGRFRLQKLLNQMLNAKCKYAVIETTSEGLAQHRARGIDFNAAVLTNLSPEHIDSHGSFEKYKQAKGILFKALDRTNLITDNYRPGKSRTRVCTAQRSSCAVDNSEYSTSIVNLDDKYANYFLKFRAHKRYGYALEKPLNRQYGIKDIKYRDTSIEKIIAQDIKFNQTSTEFKIHNINFKINLLGEFNVYNALAAICVGLSQGMSLINISKALKVFKGVPGRMEFVQKIPFSIIVDYAHTPEALEKVYQAIKPRIVVLGACGGGRDKAKRPILGKIAAKYADLVIITNEDPYDEDPIEIINQVAEGAISAGSNKILKILDRRLAIRKALKMSKPNDVVIITGKGCEPWLCAANNKKIPWDDRKVVRQELKRIDL